MKIAIHHREGSFSTRWINYCEHNNIDFKVVNAFDTDIVEQLENYDIFMWHHHHNDYKDVLASKKILYALEHAGVTVFPNARTSWHFDDKVAQKYLLEALGSPLVPSYIFYDKNEAIQWAKTTSYPKVFKLRGGAGASNVSLVKSYKEARAIINKAFGVGFEQFNRFNNLNERIRKLKSGEGSVTGVVKGVGRLFIAPDYSKQQPPEKGYAYFQDFMPHNDSDTRVIVIKDKAFAVKRMVRPNDFRASGSGNFIFDKSQISTEAIKIAFNVNAKLDSQSTAFDFVFDPNNNPLIVEISYGFAINAYDDCLGYWDKDLNWHEEPFNPQEWIIESLIKDTK